jgi:hypothetical protein
MPETETPQVAPKLFKKFAGWAFLGLMIAGPLVTMLQETVNGRKLNALALRVLDLETIYDAEKTTADAYRERPGDEPESEAPFKGTDIPGASE